MLRRPTRRAALLAVTVFAATAVLSPGPAGATGIKLPLAFSTGSATQVITVVAHSYSSTTATVQRWRKSTVSGWVKVGTPIYAHVGSQGLTHYPSESKSASPVGSFTLTQAFG